VKIFGGKAAGPSKLVTTGMAVVLVVALGVPAALNFHGMAEALGLSTVGAQSTVGSCSSVGDFSTISPCGLPSSPNVNTVLRISTSPIYDGHTAIVSSSELQAGCADVTYETLQGGSVEFPQVGQYVPVIIDADGNVDLVVNGYGCTPGRYAVNVKVEPEGATATTILVVNPPQITFPYRAVGSPANEVETGNTAQSGHSDVYSVFQVSVSPAYAEDTVLISSPKLLARCKAGIRWESNGVASPYVNSATGSAVLDNDGNATFVFKGASCQAGTNKVTFTVELGPKKKKTLSTNYSIVAPAVSYTGPQPGITISATPDPVTITGG
jgi:hypothetical protein